MYSHLNVFLVGRRHGKAVMFVEDSAVKTAPNDEPIEVIEVEDSEEDDTNQPVLKKRKQ